MKRNMKKVLALLLAVAMIATTVSVDGIRSVEEAQAAAIGIQPDESFDKITFSDFGSLDATYANGQTGEGRAKGRDTLDKTVIRGEVYVGSVSNKLQFFLGNKDHAWGGLAVEILSATDMTVAWGNSYLVNDFSGRSLALIVEFSGCRMYLDIPQRCHRFAKCPVLIHL